MLTLSEFLTMVKENEITINIDAAFNRLFLKSIRISGSVY